MVRNCLFSAVPAGAAAEVRCPSRSRTPRRSSRRGRRRSCSPCTTRPQHADAHIGKANQWVVRQPNQQEQDDFQETLDKWWWCKPMGITRRLQTVFNEFLLWQPQDNTDVPVLLRNWETYQKSLPVRDVCCGPLILHELPCYTEEQELRRAANLMFATERHDRPGLPFIMAPPGGGKTSCVLPIFLKYLEDNPQFSHRSCYLYMPFYNNKSRFHCKVDEEVLSVDWPDSILTTREYEELGGQYMLACVQAQMHLEPEPGRGYLERWRPWHQRYKSQLTLDDFQKLLSEADLSDWMDGPPLPLHPNYWKMDTCLKDHKKKLLTGASSAAAGGILKFLIRLLRQPSMQQCAGRLKEELDRFMGCGSSRGSSSVSSSGRGSSSRGSSGRIADGQQQEQQQQALPMLLIHWDEHGKFCTNPHLRRGAAEVLLEVVKEPSVNLHVVATYTEAPNLPDRALGGTSGSCQFPVPKPALDPRMLLTLKCNCHVPHCGPLQNELKRAVASCLLLLGLCVVANELVHLHRPSIDEDSNVIAKLQQQLRNPTTTWRDLNAILVGMLDLTCSGAQPKLASLLQGMQRSDFVASRQEKEIQAMSLVVVGLTLACSQKNPEEVILSVPLLTLLRSDTQEQNATAEMVFNRSRRLLCKAIRHLASRRQPEHGDVCAHRVLERAMLMALACRAALCEKLQLANKTFAFKCREVESGRLLRDNGDFEDTCNVNSSVLYYAYEDRRSHKAADLWFRSGSTLVLIDVGGSSQGESVRRKVRAMRNTVLTAERSVRKPFGCTDIVGVVIMPNTTLGTYCETKSIVLIVGNEARRLMGGLTQLLTYLPDLPDD